MKSHTITRGELLDFIQKEEVLFASSSREKKRLYVRIRGGFIITVGGKVVHEGMSIVEAVSTYNSITEKYRETKESFKL